MDTSIIKSPGNNANAGKVPGQSRSKFVGSNGVLAGANKYLEHERLARAQAQANSNTLSRIFKALSPKALMEAFRESGGRVSRPEKILERLKALGNPTIAGSFIDLLRFLSLNERYSSHAQAIIADFDLFEATYSDWENCEKTDAIEKDHLQLQLDLCLNQIQEKLIRCFSGEGIKLFNESGALNDVRTILEGVRERIPKNQASDKKLIPAIAGFHQFLEKLHELTISAQI